MRHIALTVIILFSFVQDASAELVHVYLLGGQSNANGRGDAADIPVDSPLAGPQADVSLWYRSTQVAATNNFLPQNQIIDLAPGAGYGNSNPVFPIEFGSELGIGRTLADAFPNQNVMLIKGTRGGTNLHTNWAEGGFDYDNFIITVNQGLDAIVANGDTPIMMGMFWVQGESDTSLVNGTAYGANLVDLIERVSDDFFGGNEVPFVLSQLSDNQVNNTLSDGFVAVRNNQMLTAANDPNVGFIRTDANSMFTTRVGDVVHFDANGQINLGLSLGSEMVGIISGSQTDFLIGENFDFEAAFVDGNNTDSLPGWSIFGGATANGFGSNTGSDGAPDAPSLFLGNDHGIFQVLGQKIEPGVTYAVSLLSEQTGGTNAAIEVAFYAENSPGSAVGGNQSALSGVSLLHSETFTNLSANNSFDLISTAFVANESVAGQNLVIAISESDSSAAFVGFDSIVITATREGLPGDVNGDGTVNLLDVQPFIDAISAGEINRLADINLDGLVNLLDVGEFIDLLGG